MASERLDSVPPPPVRVLTRLRELVATEADFEKVVDALEDFYEDIRDSFRTEGVPEETCAVVDDYVTNQYF